MSKHLEEINLEDLKTGAEVTTEYVIEDFEGYDFEVKTVRGQSCELCGYGLSFGFKLVKTANGKEKVPKRYRMEAKNFPPKPPMKPNTDKELLLKQFDREVAIWKKAKDQSVLPEIMLKLANSRIVEVVNKTPVGEESEPEKAVKSESKK